MNSGSTIPSKTIGRTKLVGALLLTAIVISLLARLGQFEDRVYDWFQQYQYQSGSDQILLVTSDPESIGNSKLWTAAGFAELTQKLNSMGAGVVAATEPLRLPELPPEEQIQALAELERQAARSGDSTGNLKRLTAQLAGFRKNYDEQRWLQQQLAKAGNVVLPLAAGTYAGSSKIPAACAAHGVNQQGAEPGSRDAAPVVSQLLTPPSILCSSSRTVGVIGSLAGTTPSAHATNLLVQWNDILLPSLPLAILAARSGDNQSIIVATSNSLTLDDQVIRTNLGFEVLHRFYSTRDNSPEFQSASADDIIQGRIDPALVEGRLILVGNGDSSAFDKLSPSPLFATATALSNLINNEYLLRPGWLVWMEWGMVAAVMLLVLLWPPGMPAIGALLVGLVMATIVLSIEAWLLVSAHIWVQLGTVSLFAACSVWLANALPGLSTQGKAGHKYHSASGPRGSSPQDELDLQFSVLRQQAMTDNNKEKLYQIAFKHGRDEEFAKAERVLHCIYQHDPHYKDVATLLEKLSGQQMHKPVQKDYAPLQKTGADQTAAQGDVSQKTLGRYTIERKLGEGAMATVYLARDPKIGRKVAIKTVALAEEFDDASLEEARQQFMREAESAGRLNHPHIISIYDVGEDRDVSYLAMEYFEGVSLLKHAQRDDLLPAASVMELMARAADALDYAHRQGVVHRDIKPANIMYHAVSDELKITDFGIARLTDTSRTKTGIILGTPSYMSPEQLMASGVTGQSDLYSLGVTLYQLLTGVAPFRADSIPKLMDKIMREEAHPITQVRADLPACADSVMTTVLAKKPEDRYSSGRAMAMALRECASEFRSPS
jgi:CHASE2 domain-containing sensor protein/tRNA A-37 threonylcarbamoyl transferase component Bud32